MPYLKDDLLWPLGRQARSKRAAAYGDLAACAGISDHNSNDSLRNQHRRTCDGKDATAAADSTFTAAAPAATVSPRRSSCHCCQQRSPCSLWYYTSATTYVLC